MYAPTNPVYTSFTDWWESVLRVAERTGLPVNKNDQEAYRGYYDDGCTAREALEQDYAQ